jgi:hypothetical protein
MADPFSSDVINLGPVEMRSGAADPTAGGGVVAPLGSLYQRTNGTVFVKSGAGATAWTILGTGNAMVPIETIDVAVATDTVTFAAVLNGDADNSIYVIRGSLIIPAVAGTVVLRLEPNSDTGVADKKCVTRFFDFANTLRQTGDGLVFSRGGGTANENMDIECYFYPETGKARTLWSRVSINEAVNVGGRLFASKWDDTAVNVISLRFRAFDGLSAAANLVATGIQPGSRFALYKLPWP